MGTRSLTHIKKSAGHEPFVTIYRQMDGYPTGMGADIKRILGSRKLVNGYTPGEEAKQANGIGCAAALLIAGLKGDKCGSIYIEEPGKNDMWENYVYTIWPDNDRFMLRCQYADGQELYAGPLEAFDPEKIENEAA